LYDSLLSLQKSAAKGFEHRRTGSGLKLSGNKSNYIGKTIKSNYSDIRLNVDNSVDYVDIYAEKVRAG